MAEKVIVACSLPNGLVLDHTDQAGNLVKVKIRGTAEERLRDSDGVPGEVNAVYAGYGLTPIDKDFWDAWVASPANKDTAIVKNGMIFATVSASKTKDEAKERAKDEPATNSLLPLDPKKKGMGKQVSPDIQEAEGVT